MNYTKQQIKHIKFWLQRTCDERMQQAKLKIGQASNLNFQRHNFDTMRFEVQQEVVNELLVSMSECYSKDTNIAFKCLLEDEND